MSDEPDEPPLPPLPWMAGNHDEWTLGYEGRLNASGRFIMDADGNVIAAVMMSHFGYATPDEVDTLVRLFLATPKLLAALEKAVRELENFALYGDGLLDPTSLSDARAAIRDATEE